MHVYVYPYIERGKNEAEEEEGEDVALEEGEALQEEKDAVPEAEENNNRQRIRGTQP